MDKYIGVKIVNAEPQFKRTTKTVGGKIVDSKGEDGCKVVYEDGYISWSPKDAFEKAYRRIDAMTFGLAIEALNISKAVRRKSWDDNRQIFIWYEEGNIVKNIMLEDSKHIPIEHWSASQDDILAEDWMVVE